MLEYNRSDAQTNKNTTVINGTDGELTHLNTYAPFDIVFKLFYTPIDYADRLMFEQELIEKYINMKLTISDIVINLTKSMLLTLLSTLSLLVMQHCNLNLNSTYSKAIQRV